MAQRTRLWAIVLAGGDGTRLASVTRRLYGYALPKQFANLVGEGSLLQQTVRRIAPLVPAGRTVIVVPAPYAELAVDQLASWPELSVVAQPKNLDTGPGVLLGLAAVLARDPAAHAILVPSDHHVAAPAAFVREMATAAATPGPFTLVGVRPDAAEADYGWILPGRSLAGGAFAVARFVEKPPVSLAERFLAEGALWNTFVMAGPAQDLWRLAADRLPEHAAAIAPLGQPGGERAEAYARLTAANFSREVLEPSTARLTVVPIDRCGWSDLGTPERVLAARRSTHEIPMQKSAS